MKGTALIVLLAMVTTGTTAQSKWRFQGIPELGVVWNSMEVDGDARLTLGATTKGFMLGAGFGADLHRINTLPLYVQGRKTIGNGRYKPFVVASLGANLPGEKHKINRDMVFIDEPSFARPPWGFDYLAGIYAEGGAGFDMAMSKKLGLQLSLSYSHKTLQEIYFNTVWNGNNESSEEKFETRYLMNRLALRLGLRF